MTGNQGPVTRGPLQVLKEPFYILIVISATLKLILLKKYGIKYRHAEFHSCFLQKKLRNYYYI